MRAWAIGRPRRLRRHAGNAGAWRRFLRRCTAPSWRATLWGAATRRPSTAPFTCSAALTVVASPSTGAGRAVRFAGSSLGGTRILVMKRCPILIPTATTKARGPRVVRTREPWVRASEGGVGPSGQWPELELVVEPEEECLSNSASVEQLLQRYSAAEKADGAGQAHGLPAEAMPSAADLQFDPERRQWVSFQARCAAAPEQVLRHCRSTAAGAPLWPRKTPGAPRPPPACPRCGGERIFEYQVRRSLSRGSACVCEFVGVCVCVRARARGRLSGPERAHSIARSDAANKRD